MPELTLTDHEQLEVAARAGHEAVRARGAFLDIKPRILDWDGQTYVAKCGMRERVADLCDGKTVTALDARWALFDAVAIGAIRGLAWSGA